MSVIQLGVKRSFLKGFAMRRVLLGVSLILLGFIYSAFAYAASLTLESVVGESTEQSSLVQLAFNTKIGDENNVSIEDHGSFLQIVITGISVLNPGTFYDGNSPFIRKIAAFQIDEAKVGVRLFVTKDANLVKPAVTFDRLGKQLAIHLDHELIKQSHTPAPVPGVPSAEEVIENTQIRKDIPDPAAETHGKKELIEVEKNQAKPTFLNGLISADGPLDAKLDAVAIFSAIILLVYLIGWALKRHHLRKPSGSAQLEPLQMKTLSTYAIAPKQSLKLIEIGSKKVLLSVSPDGINYLTSIENDNSNRNQQSISASHQSVNRPIQAMPTPPLQMTEGRARTSNHLLTDETPRRKTNPTRSVKNRSTASKILDDSSEDGVRVSLNSSRTNKVGSQTRSHDDADIPAQSASIEDVTNLIRRKLKDLPKI
jgi:flagellar biogenesis protein FliO